MENFQRDLERNRVKKEPGENIRKKWSVLFISSTGKIFNLTYIRSAALILLFFVLFLIAGIIFLFTTLKFVKDDNQNLENNLEKTQTKLLELKKENEQLRIKLAFLKPSETLTSQEKNGEKKDFKREDKQEEKKNIIKDFSKIPLETRNFKIESTKGQVRVNFDLVNISKSDLIISGYVFVLLSNENISETHWMISPYSKITRGKPSSPQNGQYFSIQRFKPVTIKFPGISSTGVLNKADIFIYAEDGELVLKKGFDLNEN